MNNYTPKIHPALFIIATILIILFFYTAVSKLLDMAEFRKQLANQTLPAWSIGPLLWIIPICELLVSALLTMSSTRLIGFYLSTVLMFIFTVYMGLVLSNIFDRIPCSCGGVLSSMGFVAHFFFNLFFLTLSIVGIYISHAQRKGGPVSVSD